MNLVFLLYIMLFSVCDCWYIVVPSGADESSIFIVYYVILSLWLLWYICGAVSSDESSIFIVYYVILSLWLLWYICGAVRSWNLVFLLYIMLFSVCDCCDIFVVPSGADESSIFIVYYVILSLCCDILWCRQDLMNLVFLLYIMLFSVCDCCDILWCRQELMNLVFVYYVILSLWPLWYICGAVRSWWI